MSLAVLTDSGNVSDAPVRGALKIFERRRKDIQSLAAAVSPEGQINFARAFCARVVETWWRSLVSSNSAHTILRRQFAPFDIVKLQSPITDIADELGAAAAILEADIAGFQIGSAYTAMLPSQFRSDYGVFYTPPDLANRLLDLATEAGTDWSKCRILDPACGGGAFLAPVAKRILDVIDGSPIGQLDQIAKRLHGHEIDPFAAWLAQVTVDAVVLPLVGETGERLPILVSVRDSLRDMADGALFDLIIGNPPYGRVKLDPEERVRFQRSLYGHANLYGLFTDVALRHTRLGGVIAYVTPTSFLAGEYFKNLRELLGRSGSPVSLDFVEARKGVFDGVLQETLLSTYKRGTARCSIAVNHLVVENGGGIGIESVGQISLPKRPGEPWILPRSSKQAPFVNRLIRLKSRLSDWGYRVSTGPLVWNRYKEQLSNIPGKNRFPLIWAESILSDGRFNWRADKRNHTLYFEIQDKDGWLLTEAECVLLQRTTAKEQSRRLIAGALPQEFIDRFGAVVIENHLNILKPIVESPLVSTRMLAAFLNSKIIDSAFRCISGSVAVSAYELENIPLPPPEKLSKLENLIGDTSSSPSLEEAFSELFGT